MPNKVYLVTNRSASKVIYSVPDLGVKIREFQPGETKKISFEELEGLNYQPGGPSLIANYLQIQDVKAQQTLIGQVEPEYNMSIDQVKELILHGSLDEWLDCLDFAPEGVIDIIKELSVELPLTDTRKMETFQQKFNVNLANAIKLYQEEKVENRNNNNDKEAKARRVNKEETKTENTKPERRTSGSKYNVVKKG